ncbi:hypothetical protein EJ04DRAFT_421381, partial [Polyplosphaeria fusca]
RATAIDRAKPAQKQKKGYKVLLEAVTAEKKKLRSKTTYSEAAPPGYTFVPIGYPDLSEHCRETCRRRKLDVYIVSARPGGAERDDPDKISHHIWRIGYHFPDAVVREAVDSLGYVFRRDGKFISRRKQASGNKVASQLARSMAGFEQRMQRGGKPATERETREQVGAAIRDLFPKIPDGDADAIIARAWESGRGTVGNASHLSLARRVQLAVGAHIRHVYTPYDTLLHADSADSANPRDRQRWQHARTVVEPITLSKLKEWRDEGDSAELEETFREVIILDDDDSDDVSDDESEDTSCTADGEEP